MAYRRERLGPSGRPEERFNWVGVDMARGPEGPGEATTTVVMETRPWPQHSTLAENMEMMTRLYAPLPQPGPRYPLNLGGLIQWLEGQDPATRYDWRDSCSCLVARFLMASIGTIRSGYSYEKICGGTGDYHFIGANAGYGQRPCDWTYGQALARAKVVRASGMSPGDYEERTRAFYAEQRVMSRYQPLPVPRRAVFLEEAWMS